MKRIRVVVLLSSFGMWTACNADRPPPSDGGLGGEPLGVGGNAGGGAGAGGTGGGLPGSSDLALEVSSKALTVRPRDLVRLHGQPRAGAGQYRISWKQTTGAPVKLDLRTSPNPSFTAPSTASDEDLTFVVTVRDETGTSASESVRVSVSAPGLMVQATEKLSVPEGQTVALHSRAAGGDGSYTVNWRQISGTPVSLSGAHTTNPTFVAPRGAGDETLEFQVDVSSNGDVASEVVTVSVFETLVEADAGTDQALSEVQRVSLHGRASGGSRDLSYRWAQLLGPEVLLEGANESDAAFVTPAVTKETPLRFRLTASDGTQRDTDDVNFTVTPNFPEAYAGADAKSLRGQIAQLTGDAWGGTAPYSYAWLQLSGSSASLSQAATRTLSVDTQNAADNETLTFEWSVTDALGHVVADEVELTVLAPPSQALAADAGADPDVYEGGLMLLSGLALGGTAPYSATWRQPSAGSEAALGLSSPSGQPLLLFLQAPPVSADETATVELTVSDLASTLETDTALVTVRSIPFLVSAGGDRRVLVSDRVQLHAHVEQARGPVAYQWSQVSGPLVQFSQKTSSSPSFIPLSAGTVVLSVTAADNINSATDELSIEVEAPAAKVEAGSSQVVMPEDAVYLHGSVSGAVGPYSYAWKQTGTGPQVALADATSANPHFVAPAVSLATTLSFELNVTDKTAATTTDSVSIEVSPSPIIAQAGATQEVYMGTLVSLHGAASGGTPPMTYSWGVLEDGMASVKLNDTATLNPSFIFPSIAQEGAADVPLTFVLTVSDAGGQTQTAQVEVTGRSPLPPDSKSALPAGFPEDFTPSTTYGTPPAALNILQCGDLSTRTACTELELALAVPIPCPAERPYAMNDIFLEVGGGVSTRKEFRRCVDERECDARWLQTSSADPHCLDLSSGAQTDTGTAQLACHLCCYGEMCNHLTNPADETLYRP